MVDLEEPLPASTAELRQIAIARLRRAASLPRRSPVLPEEIPPYVHPDQAPLVSPSFPAESRPISTGDDPLPSLASLSHLYTWNKGSIISLILQVTRLQDSDGRT